MSDIRIRKMDGTYVVRAGGAVLGESSAVLELSEDDRTPALYFPRGDIAMAFLDASETKTICPHKGEASYLSIVTKSKVIKDAAWSYETPNNDVARIAMHLSFAKSDEVAVEKL
ncbi:DUF427 domain-containing protein [Planktotalea arctica]|uniref:DUF427 domain-containing protein n=1 Tax=Planktotalea arctica TaxID=1481893 RepID=UPI000A174BA5|nr:DUF427 domain-containing protein [Planktotalea arctica]